MIRSYKKMQSTQIRALDGEIGKLKDIYFDDRSWKIQFFVIELGSWFSSESDILIPPETVSSYDGISLKVELTKDELRSCPNVDSAIPVSLQQQYRINSHQNPLHTFEGYLNYRPMVAPPMSDAKRDISGYYPHLRSCKIISNYELVARDADIGTLKDLLIDDSLWLIRFMVAVIDGQKGQEEKLYRPQLIDEIEWALAVVKIAMTRNQALSQPIFNPSRHVDISYEVLVRDLFDLNLNNVDKRIL